MDCRVGVAYSRRTYHQSVSPDWSGRHYLVECLFDTIGCMHEVSAADVLREICHFRPTQKMGVRPGSHSWEPITYVRGVDVTDIVKALQGEGLIVDTLHMGLQPTERGRAVAERLGPDGHLDLPLPPDPVL